MAVKIRLQRFGRKKRAYYHIVVADSRSPRDGKFIERIGDYNPNSNPASINLELDKAVKWMQNGAQPTDTCRAILSYKGAMYRLHLLKGVNKGALTEELAEEKFSKWLEEKETRVQNKRDKLFNEADSRTKQKLAAEAKVNADRAARIAAKNSPIAEEVIEVEEAAPEVEATENTEPTVETAAE